MCSDVCREYRRGTGREVSEDFPYWEPCHVILLGNGIMGWANIGGDVDQVNGPRVTSDRCVSVSPVLLVQVGNGHSEERTARHLRV
jgi:kynurenine formamidase